MSERELNEALEELRLQQAKALEELGEFSIAVRAIEAQFKANVVPSFAHEELGVKWGDGPGGRRRLMSLKGTPLEEWKFECRLALGVKGLTEFVRAVISQNGRASEVARPQALRAGRPSAPHLEARQ